MALKDIVTLAQSRATAQADTMSSRTRFMTETLNNLKNNKTRKTAATQHQGGDAVERMKKFLSGLGKEKHVPAHEPLRVSLEDLHSAESKGKCGEPETDDVSTAALLKLARKQGMNTDIRRSVFVVLMSSDDYLDACERLAQLGLTEVQQHKIIRVNLHCCGNVRDFIGFCTAIHLSQRIRQCGTLYTIWFPRTLQFCLWGFLRDLGESSVGGVEVIRSLKDNDVEFDNVAKAYTWWIAKDCCALTIFKLFIANQVSSPMLSNDSGDYPSVRNRGSVEEIFLKASRIENLGLGLVFFMSDTFKGEHETLQNGMEHVPRI
ncbi:hypothetical protein BD769DRAFT_1457825 [Suillus cothurnatus]|nr:hypothetical protein BD769DRAFT_1457825 [Suillus cothurnatus]